MKIKLSVNFLSYWHAGTGLGDGAGHDASVLRDTNGLPFLPGKSLKGVLRNAMKKADKLGWFKSIALDDITTGLFGASHLDDEQNRDEANRSTQRQSIIFVSNATLPANDILFLTDPANAELIGGLFRRVASTKINDDTSQGTAVDGSLRAMEVAVPLDLTAEISIDESLEQARKDAFKQAILLSLPLVEGLGAKRTRGFGKVEILEVQDAG